MVVEQPQRIIGLYSTVGPILIRLGELVLQPVQAVGGQQRELIRRVLVVL